MGQTIAQKILARAAGRAEVSVGETVACRPDHMIAYDFPGYTDLMARQMKELGIDTVAEPERYVLFIDHLTPAQNEKEEAFHNVTRAWAKEQGIALHEGMGIGHRVSVELGYGLPGDFVVHFDGHVSQLGAQGCLAMGIRRDLLPAWVTGEVWLDVPASQRFTLTGALQPGVLSRDLLHHIIGEIDADGCVDQVMEFTGPAARSVSLDGRAALCGLAMFTGAVTAVFNPDALSLDYARRRARRAFTPVESDPDAEYAVDHECDLAAIEPQVVEPPSPRNSRPIAAMEGTPVTQGYIGSCASGRLEDIRAAAEVLEGRQVARGFKLYVVPTSNQIMAQAAAEGLLEIVLEAGGYVAGPSCDFCFGHAGALAPRDVCISTGTLNIPGRMGSFDARIYLGSAYTVAASAIEGRIADPRRYVRRTP